MTLERMLRYVVLTGIFILPLIVLYVSRQLFFPFITGKNFAFRIIVEIMAGGYLALAIVNPVYRPKRSWLLWAFAALVVIIGIADIFGVYPFKSFWSNYERMEGWVTLAHLLVYFVIMSSMLTTERLWRAFWHTSLAVSTLVAVYGLFQLAGWTVINQGGVRLDSRLGNATYLAIYMYFHVFIAALLLVKTWVEKGVGNRAPWVVLYGGSIALNTFILFYTATRGAILGLIGGAMLSALILVVLAPRSRIAWRAGVGVAVLIVVAGVFWLARDTAFVRSIEPLSRLATISTSETTIISRFMNVGMAWEGFKERPILGWGQENYAAVFDKYYNPNMYAQEPWFDRTHNIVMDWLIAGGILGLLAYLSLYFFALLAVWRSGAFEPYERAMLTGLLAGYFFYLLFTFDNITSYLLFVAILAYIASRAYADAPALVASRSLPRSVLPGIAVVTILSTWGIAWFVNADAIAQNRTLIRAITPQTGGPAQNLTYFKEAIEYNSAGMQEVREQLTQAGISIASAENVPVEVKQQFIAAAADEMSKQANDVPQYARFPFFLGIMFDHAGALDEGEKWLDRAHAASPNKQSIIFELGLNALARGANDEGLAYFKQAYDLAPAYSGARLYYAAALIRTGKDAEVDALLAPLIENGEAADARVASAYASRNQYDKIATIWTKYIELNPQNLQARITLAGAYYSAGNRSKSIQVLEDAKRALPESAAQIDQLIAQVRAGNVQ